MFLDDIDIKQSINNPDAYTKQELAEIIEHLNTQLEEGAKCDHQDNFDNIIVKLRDIASDLESAGWDIESIVDELEN